MLMLDSQEAEEGAFKNTLQYSNYCDYNSDASVCKCSELNVERHVVETSPFECSYRLT